MMKKILISISQGNLTLAEIAQKVNIGKEELLNRFEMMERMGYLERTNNTTSSSRTHEQCKICTFCPVASKCLKKDIPKSDYLSYRLTAKGHRAAHL